MKRTLATTLTTLLLSVIMLVGATPVSVGATEAKADITSESIFRAVNNIRVENGLQALKVDTSLVRAAQIRAEEASIVWSHTRPNGTSCFTVCENAYGENLAFTYEDDVVTDVINMWMNSLSHRDNILFSEFETMGIATYVADNGDVYVAQIFGY